MSGCIKQTQLFCGKGETGVFVDPDNPTAIVGKVFVNARNISKPTVSIEFSSIISFLGTDNGLTPNAFGAEGRLRFELFRVGKDKLPASLKTWSYEVSRIENVFEGMRFTDSFNFNFCDSLHCTGCYEYFVEVSVENLVTANIVVNNAYITALV